MGIFLILVAVFDFINQSILCLICITLFLFTYQAATGNLFWPYAGTVLCQESSFSITSLVLWGMVLFQSTCTQFLMKTLTTAGTFLMFGCITILGGFFFIVFLKEIKGVPKADLPLLYCSDEVKGKIRAVEYDRLNASDVPEKE